MKPFIAEALTNGKRRVLRHRRILPPPMDKSQATECLLKVKDIFDRHNITFYLVGGTLLGAVRDGGFIPWDDDIDLGMRQTSPLKLIPAIREMEDFGLKVIRTNKIDNTFQVKRNLICIAFAPHVPYRGKMWRWWRFYEPFDAFSELIPWSFLGKDFLIPAKNEEYLKVHYGDWRTPDPTCKHAKMFRIPRRDL